VTDVRDKARSYVDRPLIFRNELIREAQLLGFDWGNRPLLSCGALGQPENWHYVPQVDCPTDESKLADAAALVPDTSELIAPYGLHYLVPGMKVLHEDGHADVARSEEVKALACPDGLLCLPGTHCKWIEKRSGTITDFRTFLTGDLYAMVSERGAVAAVMTADSDISSFLKGVRASRNEEPLLHTLFTVRADSLLDRVSAPRSYLQGLLIGEEIRSAGRYWPDSPVVLVCGGEKAELYRIALQEFGRNVICTVDPEGAVWTGLAKIAPMVTHR
jgi:2-dehydro-3-deoxygalactonokinase